MKKQDITNPITRLKKEHAAIIKDVDNFEKSLARIGNNLNAIEGFLGLFDSKISQIIKLEETTLFPYLEEYAKRDEALFVMEHTHEIIKSEFGKLRNALANNDVHGIRKSGERLVEMLRYHIEKEDGIILKEAEERLGASQISYFSDMLNLVARQQKGACN